MFSKCCTADFPPKQEGARRQRPSWREKAAAILPISRVICNRASKNYFPRIYSKDHGKSCTVGYSSGQSHISEINAKLAEENEFVTHFVQKCLETRENDQNVVLNESSEAHGNSS